MEIRLFTKLYVVTAPAQYYWILKERIKLPFAVNVLLITPVGAFAANWAAEPTFAVSFFFV